MVYSPGLRGRCLDGSNSPVAEAVIYSNGSNISIATSDKEGFFLFSPEMLSQAQEIMIFTAYQHDLNLGGVLFKDADWTENMLMIQMKPIQKVSGKLVTANGGPIVGGNIELVLGTNPNVPYTLHNRKIASTQTDENGIFYLEIIPHSYSSILQATTEGHEKIHLPLGNNTFNLKVSNLGDIVLRASSMSVSGYLVDQLGYPIKGIELSISEEHANNQKPVVTDSEGRFAFENVAEGNIRLKANYKWDLYEYGTFQAGTENNRFVLENKYENGRWIYARDNKPLDGAHIEVTLFDDMTGNPVTGKGSHLHIIGDNISNPFIDPDSSGKVIFSADSGNYVLEAEKFPDYPKTRIEVTVETGKKYEFVLAFNEKPKLTGKITDIHGNAIDNVEFRIYPMEYYTIENSEVLGDGTYELAWDASKYQAGRDPYLYIESPDNECGRIYKIDKNLKQLDITLEPTSYLIFEDKQSLIIDVTFFDKQWENYSHLNTYLDIQTTNENGLLRVSGIFPIPEELQYHLSVSYDEKPKEAFIKAGHIKAGEEIILNLEDSNQ